MLRRFKEDIRLLRNVEHDLSDKVEIIHGFCNDAGFGESIKEFLQADGIKVLVHISTAEWPEDGDLENSCSIYDKSVPLKYNRVRYQGMACDDNDMKAKSYHSMRRVAVGCLGEMCNYLPYVIALVREQLYTHFPRMLRHTVRRYKFGQSYSDMYGAHKGRRTDHAQFICERLCNIMANTFRCLPLDSFSTPTFLLLTQHCIPVVAYHIDILKMESRLPKNARSTGVISQSDSDHMFDSYTRCVNTMLAMFTMSKSAQLSKEIRLIYFKLDLLARIQNLPTSDVQHAAQRQSCCGMLQADYEQILEDIYLPRVMQHVRFKMLASNVIKDQGNSLYAEGAHKLALQKYRAALELDVWNTAAAANASVCLLRLGAPRKALQMAMLAVTHNPTWAKGWARIAEALMALGDKERAECCVGTTCVLDSASASAYAEVLDQDLPAPSASKKLPHELAATWGRLVELATAEKGIQEMGYQLVHNHSGHWTMSMATFGMVGEVLGEAVFVLSITNGYGQMMDTEPFEGIPSPDLLTAFFKKNVVNSRDRGGKPTTALVAFRLAYAWPDLKAMAKGLGVQIKLENRHDAELSAWRNNTDFLGFNGEDVGRKKYMPLMCDVEHWTLPAELPEVVLDG